MAILKMDVFGYDTTWLPEVDKVISKFHVDPQEEPRAAVSHLISSLVLAHLHRAERKDILQELQENRWYLGVPENHPDKVILLKIFRGECVEYWVAPEGRTYLMANDGKTIDRI